MLNTRVHKTHVEYKQTNENTTQKSKKMSNMRPTKHRVCTLVLAKDNQFMSLIRLWYSYSQDTNNLNKH
jgi:hypothetical protein